MAYKNLRGFLEALAESDRLRHVTAEVDKDWEIACIARWASECTEERNRYALCFDAVRGYQSPVVVGLYASRGLYASALKISPDEILSAWSRALSAPIKPSPVDAAPVHSTVEIGDDVNLCTIPIPTWTPGRDAGPYIPSASVITKDPETGVQNMGVYRLQLHDRKRTGLFFGTKMQHGAMHYARYCQRDEPMPVALVIGGPPALHFAAAAKTAYGVDELEIAGALAGSSIEVARGKTVDLWVPAEAEYVIEGFVPPDKRLMEGPFGEALGYMVDAAPAPIVEVSAVCSRPEPVFHGYLQQLPPSEGHLIWELGTLGPLWFYLTEKMGVESLRDLAIVKGSAGLSMLAVQIEAGQREAVRQIGRILAELHFGQKFIILVDEDIDIRDLESLNWALSSRSDPARDIQLVENVSTYQPDPAILAALTSRENDKSTPPFSSSMMIIDATLKCDTPEISLPGKSLMARVQQRWPELGLPPLVESERLQRLLAHHSEEDHYYQLPESCQRTK